MKLKITFRLFISAVALLPILALFNNCIGVTGNSGDQSKANSQLSGSTPTPSPSPTSTPTATSSPIPTPVTITSPPLYELLKSPGSIIDVSNYTSLINQTVAVEGEQYIAGSFGGGEFNFSSAGWGVFVAKISHDNKVIWGQVFKRENTRSSHFRGTLTKLVISSTAVYVAGALPNGGKLVTEGGPFFNSGSATTDASYLIRLDLSGNLTYIDNRAGTTAPKFLAERSDTALVICADVYNIGTCEARTSNLENLWITKATSEGYPRFTSVDVLPNDVIKVSVATGQAYNIKVGGVYLGSCSSVSGCSFTVFVDLFSGAASTTAP